MSATDWVVASLTIVLVLLTGALVAALAAMARTQRQLAESVGQLQRETVVLVEAMTAAVTDAGYQIDRVDALLDAANSVEQTLDSASRIAFRTVTNPVVKAMALGTGTKRAVQRMRTEPVGAPRKRGNGRRRAKRGGG